MRKDIALFLLLIGAFASLFFDIRYEHRDVLQEQWQSWIPLFASGVAILATLLAFASGRTQQRLAAALFLLVTLVGFGGVYFHTKLRPYMFTRYITPLDATKGPYKGLERPTFAPLAFTGLGLIGFIVVSPVFRWPKGSK